MTLQTGPIAAYRRYWLPELIVLAVLTVVTIIAFAVTDLDITSARWFYHPGRKNLWPVAYQPVWIFFGLPSNTVNALWEYRDKPVSTLQFRVIQQGWFPDLDGVARIELPREKLKKIIVRVNRGDISVNRGNRELTKSDFLPVLDLKANEGRIQQEQCPAYIEKRRRALRRPSVLSLPKPQIKDRAIR